MRDLLRNLRKTGAGLSAPSQRQGSCFPVSPYASAPFALVTIEINGRRFEVSKNTSVAAAVLASGESMFRTSVSGEPRAALCGMGICFECRVEIDGRPQCRSCQLPVADGMVIRTL